jgi:formyltetrahydrofolate deformylase
MDLFLSRLEWDLTGFDAPLAEFERHFNPVADRFTIEYQLAQTEHRSRMAILVSSYDHCLADLLYRHHSGELACDIPIIISNHANAAPLAAFYNIPFEAIEGKSKCETEKEITRSVREHEIDLIVLARYMQILSAEFVSQFESKIINIHHSFLPAFIGAKPYHQAFERGVKLIGATSHYVTADLDEGPIIEQDVVRISHRDKVEDLIQKGRDLEKVVLSRAVRWHLEHRILLYGRKTVVFN